MANLPLTGLVLCGGGSRRMGRDKALIEVSGRPLVVHVAGRLAAVAEPVLLAPGRPGRLGDLGFPEIQDEVANAGPLSGIAAGLAASTHALVAVVAVDMPFANPELLALLADMLRGEDAAVPVTVRGPEPLHAVYATAALPAIRHSLAAGRLAVHEALADLSVRTVSPDEWRHVDPRGRFALNLNRAEDLPRLPG